MSRDWKFCPYSGALLEMEPAKGKATCTTSGYSKNLSELENVKNVTHTDMEEFRRRYNLVPLVKQDIQDDITNARTRATVDEECPKCGHFGLEYYTMQLRSADEGQTVFYECPACKNKYSQNT
ncbi:hypothetical protein WJX77_003594 [Trebouxia sp. C0004]